MSGNNKTRGNNSRIRRPICPRCKESHTMGYLNSRNGKFNYFCSNCSLEIIFNNDFVAISYVELFSDGSSKEIKLKVNKYSNKK